MKKVLSLFFLSALFFAFFPHVASASLEDKQYFGVTTTEANDAMLSDFGINMVYSWGNNSFVPSGTNYVKFLTLRMGKFWWDNSQQNFNTLANPDPTGCNQAISFTYGGTNYNYPYNICNINSKITSLYNSTNQSGNAQPIKYFVIGNEPNILGSGNDSDGSLPSDIPDTNLGLAAKYQAEQYRVLYNAVNAFKSTHSDVRIVGPGIIGYSSGLNNGAAWFTAFKNAYGSTPPMDYLNYHSYDTVLLNTDGTPYSGSGDYKRRLDASAMATDLSTFRTDMNNAGYSGKQIFVTEFGIPNCEVSACKLRTETEARDYLDAIINNFRANRTNYLLKGWMLFSLKRVDEGVRPANPINLKDQSSNPTVMYNWYKDKIAQEFSDVPPTITPREKFDQIQKFFLTKEATDGTKIAGCHSVEQGTTGLKEFCIGDTITRQDFSKFLIIAMQQSKSTASSIYSDVSATFVPYVMRMSPNELNITSGCGGGLFCANDGLTRGTTVIFIGRALRTLSTAFTLPTTASFNDVPYSSTGELYRDAEFGKSKSIVAGTVNGCGGTGLMLCPNENVRRDDMAVFLMRAFPNDHQYAPSDTTWP